MKGERSLDHLVLTRLRGIEKLCKDIRHMATRSGAWDQLERADILESVSRQEAEAQRLAEEVMERVARESAARRRVRSWPQSEIEFP